MALYFIGVLGAPKHHLFRKYRDHTLDHPTSGKCRGRLYQFYSTWVLGVGPPSRDKDGSTVPALSSVSRFHGKWKTENANHSSVREFPSVMEVPKHIYSLVLPTRGMRIASALLSAIMRAAWRPPHQKLSLKLWATRKRYATTSTRLRIAKRSQQHRAGQSSGSSKQWGTLLTTSSSCRSVDVASHHS